MLPGASRYRAREHACSERVRRPRDHFHCARFSHSRRGKEGERGERGERGISNTTVRPLPARADLNHAPQHRERSAKGVVCVRLMRLIFIHIIPAHHALLNFLHVTQHHLVSDQQRRSTTSSLISPNRASHRWTPLGSRLRG